MKFEKWLNTFIDEKGINRDFIIEIEKEDSFYGTNYIPVQAVLDAMIMASQTEQKAIKNTLVKIDFFNGDIMHFIKHLAAALAI